MAVSHGFSVMCYEKLLLIDNSNGLERNIDSGFSESGYDFFGIVEINIPVIISIAPYPCGNIDAGFW